VSVLRRRLTQSHGDPRRFGLAIELARRGRFLAFLAVQSELKAFGGQAFAELLDRLHAAVEGLGNFDSRPPCPIGICLEQDLSTTKLLRRSRESLDDPLTDTPLFLRQPHNVLLVHGKPACDQKLPNNSQNQQPNFLDLKTHKYPDRLDRVY
jgi:hypothetical protein